MQHESIESPASLPSGSSEVVNPQEERAAGQDGTVAHERATLDGKISVDEFSVDSQKSSSVPISSSLASSASSIDTVKTITSTSDSSASTPPNAAEPLEASTTASALSRSKASSLPQTPALHDESEEAVRVRKPHRRKNLKDAKPKGILKPPPPPVAKFSFRRDVLGYVVGEAGFTSTYAAGGPAVGGRENTDTKANTTSLQLATDGVSASSSGLQSSSQATSPTSPSAHVTSPSIAGQSVAKSSGGLWRRLGGAVTAVAGNVPVPQSALRTLNNISATVRSPLPLEHVRPASPQRPEGNDLTHTSSTAAANDEISNNSQPKYVKSVRFTMSSLAVVYPINGPAPPGVEADTRKRINKEYAAKQASRKDPAGWTTLDLLELYEDCCRTREEPGIAPLRTLLMVSLLHEASHAIFAVQSRADIQS